MVSLTLLTASTYFQEINVKYLLVNSLDIFQERKESKKICMPHKNVTKSVAVAGYQHREQTETTKMQDLISEWEFSFEKEFFSLLVSESSYQATQWILVMQADLFK